MAISVIDGIVTNPKAKIPGRFCTLNELIKEPRNQNKKMDTYG
jgi:hypothetical protein